MSVRGFRDSFREYIPTWMSDRPGRRNIYKFLYTLFLALDQAMEAVVEGVDAKFPGVGTATALPFIGRSRGIVRGEAETEAAYAARLLPWIDNWSNAGNDEQLVRAIQNYLGNKPMVRLVDRAGHWTTVDHSGNLTTTTASWNWDGTSNPERSGFWSDIWIIVYPTEWAVTGSNLASLVGIWGTYGSAQVGTGHAVPRAANDAIVGLVQQWKAAHVRVRAIIWSYDATLFDPASPVSGDPDGTWGMWGKLVAGNVAAARNQSARYWEPTNG